MNRKKIFEKLNFFYNKNYIILFLLIFFSILRSTHIFFEGRFWAEEAANYFKNAVHYGWFDSFFVIYTPSSGYYNLFPKLASVIASFFPLSYAPLVTTHLSFLILLYLFILILCCDSYIFQTRNQKIIICFFVLFAPPFVPAVWLNSVNAQVYLGILTLLILYLKNNNTSFFKYSSMSLLLLSGFSTIYSCILTPFFLIKFFFIRTKDNLIYFFIIFFSSIFQVCYFFYAKNFSELVPRSFDLFLNKDLASHHINVFMYNIFVKSIISKETFLYLSNIFHLNDNVFNQTFFIVIFLLISITIIVTYFKSYKAKDADFVVFSLILFFFLVCCLIIVGSTSGRTTGIAIGGRYAVIPSFVVLLIIFKICFSETHKFIKYLMAFLLVVSLSHGIYQFRPTNNKYITYLDCINHCEPWKKQVKTWQLRYESDKATKPYPHKEKNNHIFTAWPYVRTLNSDFAIPVKLWRFNLKTNKLN